MDLNRTAAFVRVVEAGSFTGAAAALGVRKSSVSRSVAALDAGGLERVLPRYARRSSPVHLVWPSRRFEPAAVTLFREALAEALPRSLRAAR